MSQVSNHKAYHRHIDEGFARLRQVFVILAQAALTVQPGKGALYHPPTRQGHKALLPFGFLHYRKLPAQRPLHPFDQLSPVCSVSLYQLQSAEAPPVHIASFLDALKQRFEYRFASISVLHRGSSYYYQHHQSKRVHNQVSLAPRYLLACIVPSVLTTFYCFDALAVQYGGTWLLVSALLLSQRLSQNGVEPFPLATDAPEPKVVVDTLPGWEVVRQRSPVATVLHHVEDGIEHFSKAMKTWATCALGLWHQWRNYSPFVIIEVSWVGFSGLTGNHNPESA